MTILELPDAEIDLIKSALLKAQMAENMVAINLKLPPDTRYAKLYARVEASQTACKQWRTELQAKRSIP